MGKAKKEKNLKQKNLEVLLKEIINKGDEYDKVDLKSTYDISKKKNKIRLIKCIASIANSDSTYFDNIGYIILGAKRGELVGGFNYLEKDSFSSNLQVIVKDYLDPRVNFSVERFNDSKLGWWGVIIILHSSETHVFRKEYQDLKIRRGDVYVRHGDSISLADRADYERLQRRKSKGDIQRLDNQIKNLEKVIKKSTSIKPELKLYLLDKQNNLSDTFEIHPFFNEKTKEEYRTDAEKSEEIKKIKTEIKQLEDIVEKEKNHKNQKLSSTFVSPIVSPKNHDRQELKSYKIDLSEYLEKRIQYLISYRKYLNVKIISLRFCLNNEGNLHAKGIKFYIEFPKNLKLWENKDFLIEPKFYLEKPDDPRISTSLASPWKNLLKPLIPPFSPLLPSRIDTEMFTKQTYGGPSIDETRDTTEVEFWINRLLQHHRHFCDPIFFICPEDNLDLKLTYSIYAENVPGLSEGKLIIKIRPTKS